MSTPRRAHREGWPRGLYEPRPGYFVFREKLSKVTRVIGYVSIEDAKRWVAENATVDALRRTERSRVTNSPAWRAMKSQTFHRAKTRARLYGRDIMTRHEFDLLWREAGGFCQLTGLPLQPRPEGCADRVYPWAASLDRIDSAKGYTRENCRIVCAAMNIALNAFGEQVFRSLAEAFSRSASQHRLHAK